MCNGLTDVPSKVRTAFISGKPFMIRPAGDDEVELTSSTSRKLVKVPKFSLGSIPNGCVCASETSIPLNIFRKDKPEVKYCTAMRSVVLIFENNIACECGAMIMLSFKKGEAEMTESKETEKSTQNKLDAIIESASNQETPVVAAIPKIEDATVVDRAEEKPVVAEKETEANTVDTKEVQDIPEEAAGEKAPTEPLNEDKDQKGVEEPAADTEERRKAPTDEERLSDMMDQFNDGMISTIRNNIIFLERLVKLHNKIIKKGSLTSAQQEAYASMKEENKTLKQENAKFRAHRKKLMEAMGVEI
jgi:hypothetical protein